MLLLGLAAPGAAQDTPDETATLVADEVEIQADSVLVASGNVEVLHKGTRLRAERVTFDSKADRLKIEGPLILTDEQGTRLLADQADLSSDLQDGLLQGARLVLSQQLQLAATEMQRVGGRYTELGRTVASSCQVCAANPTPLWEIRARRVVHDQQARQLYFENAQLRVAGVPVFYLPRLRLPDPTLKRATGFLQPQIRSTSELGTGVGLPYFIALGDSRDLTITPFAATQNAQSLGLRYRQAFETGQIEIEGRDLAGRDPAGRDARISFRLGRLFAAARLRAELRHPGHERQCLSARLRHLDAGRADQLHLGRTGAARRIHPWPGNPSGVAARRG